MYSDRFQQYPPQDAQFEYRDNFATRNRVYQDVIEPKISKPQLREITPVGYQNHKYQGYHAFSHVNQNLPERYIQYPNIYSLEQPFQNDFNCIDTMNHRPQIKYYKYQSHLSNPYLEKDYPIELQKYVPINVHNSMIRHYQSTLDIVKNQNNALIIKLKNQIQKMHKLYQFTQKILLSSQSNPVNLHNFNFETQQLNDQKYASLERNLMTPAKILQNKIRSLKEKKNQQQKVKIQTIEKKPTQITNFQPNYPDQFSDQQSFLVDETVKKFQSQKKMNLKGPKANTFGIRKNQDDFCQKEKFLRTQQETQNEEYKCEFNFIEEFLDDYLCQKMTYASKKQFNNSKIQKKDLVNLFLKWRLENKGSINQKVDQKVIQQQIIEQFKKRFVSCRSDSMCLIGMIFKDSKFFNVYR